MRFKEAAKYGLMAHGSTRIYTDRTRELENIRVDLCKSVSNQHLLGIHIEPKFHNLPDSQIEPTPPNFGCASPDGARDTKPSLG